MLYGIEILSSSGEGLASFGFPGITHPDYPDQYENPVFYIKDVQGLEAPDGTITTIPNGTLIGESYSNTSIGARDIIITVGVTPAFRVHAEQYIGGLLQGYVGQAVRVNIDNDFTDRPSINGRVKSVVPVMFSADPSVVITIVCPQPYFWTEEKRYKKDSEVYFSLTPFYTSVPVGIFMRYTANAVTDYVILDNGMGQQLRWNGRLNPGDQLILNTRPGQKRLDKRISGTLSTALGGLVGDNLDYTVFQDGGLHRVRGDMQIQGSGNVDFYATPQFQAVW